MGVSDEQGRERERSRRVSPKVVVWAVVALLVIILILQNTKDVRVDLLFWDVTAGLWLLLLVVFLVGLALGWLLAKLRRGNDDDSE